MTHFVLFVTITAVAAKNSVGSPPDGIYPNAKKDNYTYGPKGQGLFLRTSFFSWKSVDAFLPKGGRDKIKRKYHP